MGKSHEPCPPGFAFGCLYVDGDHLDKTALIMSNGDRLAEYANPCTAPWRMLELASGFCLAPLLDPDIDAADPESAELVRDIKQLKRNLDIMFSDDVRRQLRSFIKQLDENRDLYRRSLLLWLDLTEEIAFQVELDLGDNTGPVKLKRVEGGIFYLLSKLSVGLQVPRVPRFMNRFVLQMVIRGTVEYIITLVNIDKFASRTRVAADIDSMGLWNRPLKKQRHLQMDELKARRKRNVVSRAAFTVRERSGKLAVSVEKQQTLWWERLANFLLDLIFAPPKVPQAFKTKIDLIIEQMNREAPSNMPPIAMMGRWFFDIFLWIGQHGKEIRAAIDAFSIAVHQTQKMSEMTRERRITVIEDALILYFDELGLSGPYFRFVLRLFVDINLDAMVFLYKKRGIIEPARAAGQ